MLARPCPYATSSCSRSPARCSRCRRAPPPPPPPRALFARPPRVIAALAGSPPPHAAGLEPDAWLVARLAAHDAIPAGSLPPDELRAALARRLPPPPRPP